MSSVLPLGLLEFRNKIIALLLRVVEGILSFGLTIVAVHSIRKGRKADRSGLPYNVGEILWLN
jgi:hypothetical protein